MVNDYCLVYYESGFDFDAEVTPACLPKSESAVEDGKSCYVAGWGKLRYFSAQFYLTFSNQNEIFEPNNECPDRNLIFEQKVYFLIKTKIL